MTEPSSGQYADDAPIHAASEDRFSRWPFAQRTAQVIAHRKDTSSLVVGIYGPWGDGKTSVLNMMAAALESEIDVVTIRFNPWRFESEAQLLRAFFDTLADAAGKKLSTIGEQVGATLKKYSGLLSLASVSLGVAHVSPGESAKTLGEQLANVELDELKERLDKLLVQSGKRIVVLVDDVDRLDRAEVHAVLKLIKLSADFANTSYVVACDDDIVAASLGERYGQGDINAGRQFLEKIIQVPLHLPNAETDDLRALTFESVDAVLNQNGIALTDQGAEAFVRFFSTGILPALTTPRQVKRYVNAIRFAVPLLKGEVHVPDQLLIEGVRVVYPALYLNIRGNEDAYARRPSSGMGSKQEKEAASAVVDAHLAELPLALREGARDLVEALFPRTKKVGYGTDWDTQWAEEELICAGAYFRRYFQYGVPNRDFPDASMANLIDVASVGDANGTDEWLNTITARRAWRRALDKLFTGIKTLGDKGRATLAISLARQSEHLPSEKGPFAALLATSSRAASLVGRLVRTIEHSEQRVTTAITVVKETDSLLFGTECLRWFGLESSKEPEVKPLTTEEREQVGGVLADRIADAVKTAADLDAFGPGLGQLLWIWKEYKPGNGPAEFLHEHFLADPKNAIRFLGTFIGRAWGLENGLSHLRDFERDSYDAVVQFVDATAVLDAIEKVYPGRSAGYSFDAQHSLKGDERIACAFVAINNHVSSTANVTVSAEPSIS